MPRWIIFAIIAILAAAGIGYYLKTQTLSGEETIVTTEARKGAFVIKVTGTGELQAKNSEKIRGPDGMRAANIYRATISDLVSEGTVVKAGDYVAKLDKSELDQKIQEIQSEIDEIMTQLDQAKIDTTIELQGLRDQLVNLKFSMEEKRLQVEQSKYEPQMVIQQAELDLERTQRDYGQLEAKLLLTQEKSIAKISEINTRLYQKQLKLNQLLELAKEFVIYAPKDGMVIYSRSWDGKVGPGSQISTWNPVVAELPDLSDMISKTYINEVEISRVQKGQEVRITVDAFPEKEFSGKVIQVANIGEQLRGYDAKVFEVTVQMLETDSVLRPAMTTSNEITTDVLEDELAVPLEAVFSDSLNYVYTRKNKRLIKQEVITGPTNSDEIVIDHGLAEGDEVYLSQPDAENIPFEPLDPSIKEKIRQEQLAEQARREEERKKKMEELKNAQAPSRERKSRGGGRIVIMN